MKSQFFKIAAAVAIATFAINAQTQENSNGRAAGGVKMDAAKTTKLTDGEVKNVDRKTGQVTLKHGAIENLNMGPMTMAFAVDEKALVPSIKVGSKVKFAVEYVNGIPTITLLVPQK